VRTIACARITMPKAMVRLSAGRQALSEGIQALCFLAGANSIFYGEKLLTTGNPDIEKDEALFARLGLKPMGRSEVS
jgi:biotin synthase